MADDSLFEFLHMEIVSHVYKEHESRGDNDKVTLVWKDTECAPHGCEMVKFLLLLRYRYQIYV